MSYSQEVEAILDRIEKELIAGLQHGHSEMTVTCAIGSKKQREVVVKAGPSYKFVVREDKLPV